MSEQNKHFYEFGPFRIDPLKRRLLRDGEPVRLTPKAFDLLLVLVEESGRTVEKDELLEKVWAGHGGGGKQPQPEHHRVEKVSR